MKDRKERIRIDHIGYAVRQLERAVASFEALGYVFDGITADPDRNVQISFGEKDGYRIELVSPLDKNQGSPVDAFLSKIGPTPYHICYKTEDLEACVQGLIQQGYRRITAPAPAVAFHGKRVVFMMSLATGMLEILEE